MAVQKDSIALPRSVIATLALEIWRLWRTVENKETQTNSVNLRYSIRKMKEALEIQGCSFIDLTGEVYDAGMAVDIIDTEGEKNDGVIDLIIKEMVAPIILFRDVLLTHGQVILERRAKAENIAKENK